MGLSEKTVYCWFSETGSIPIKKLELILSKIEFEIDKDKLFNLERN
ncbi:hypothetical protein [Terrisporobacter vanillatitrophus]